ncbi:MAG: DUF6544 family protein [Solirubrobacteraceae bacterium]
MATVDSYAPGVGSTESKVLSRWRFMHADGEDTARAAAGRAVVERLWVPGTFLPGGDAHWRVEADDRIVACLAAPPEQPEITSVVRRSIDVRSRGPFSNAKLHVSDNSRNGKYRGLLAACCFPTYENCTDTASLLEYLRAVGRRWLLVVLVAAITTGVQVETQASSTSNIMPLTARDPVPGLAAGIANAFAEAYVEFRVRSARERYSQAARLAEQQILQLSPEDRRSSQGLELQSRRRELQIAAALQTGGAEIVRRASVPTSASRPRPKLSGALGLVLGLLGVGLALGRELVDRRFKNEHTVEAFFDLPIVAAIPRAARRGRAMEAPGQREAYGLLAANLRLSAVTRSSRVLMVTSSGPAEGKTSVTFGVARACAPLGLKVVAIEADLRHPSFARFTEVSFSSGLAGVLDGSTMMAKALIRLNVDTLQSTANGAARGGEVAVLPAGALRSNTQQALSDPRIGRTIEVARSLADVSLIDTAPVGIVDDAKALTGLVDGVLLSCA